MAQTIAGAAKIAAKKAGVSLEDYLEKVAAGKKFCGLCREFHPASEFANDSSRYDGLSATCRKSRNAKSKQSYRPKARPIKGRSFVPARNGDKSQARRRVNYFVEAGILPHPNSLPCSDCGHVYLGKGRRHEYDHYLGYDAGHHEHVEAVWPAAFLPTR